MKDLFKKIGGFSVGPLVAAFLSFITVPLITYFISPDEYGRCGMFTLAQNTVSTVMYLGMDQAFVREFHEDKNTERLLSNAILFPAIFTLLLDAVLLLFPSRFSFLLFGTPGEFLAVFSLAMLFPFMLLEHFALMKLRMEEHGFAYSAFTILLKALTLAATVILFLSYEKSFRSVIYAIVLAQILSAVILFFFALRGVRLSFRLIQKPLIVRMLRYGLPLIPASALMWVLTSMDQVMLRAFTDYTELGLYTGAFKIVSVLSVLQSCFTLLWTPISLRWYESGADNKRFAYVMRLISLAMTVLCFGILLCKDVVALILGKKFALSIYIFPFLMLHPIMYTASEATSVGIAFTRKTVCNVITTSLAAVVNIALNALLIPSLGARGAAIATGISYIVFFWVRTLLSRRVWYSFPIRNFVIYTLMILVNCALHTFLRGPVPYIVSAASLLLIAVFEFRHVREAVAYLKSALSDTAP